jgi:Xaa-Pro aminopeptidase
MMSELSQALLKERGERLNAAMADEKIDVLVVVGNPWRSDYLRYATGVQIVEGHAAALVERGGKTTVFLESPAEAARIAVEQPALELSWSSSAVAQAERAIAAMAGRRIALAPAPAMPLRLASGPAAATVATATAMLDRLMLTKTPAELAAYRRAAELADEGYQVFLKGARPGRPEYALVADVESFYRSRGCAENFQILGSGGRDVRGMHPPGEKLVAAGDLVTTELTPCYEGYYAQICRTCVVGEPSAAQTKAFTLYNEAMEAGIAAVRPGVKASDVARALNDVFRKAGLGNYVTSEYTRVRGHGLGLYTDARPALLEDVDAVLETDMTLVVHPNTYHPEVGYFVHGDSVRVTPNGCEVLIRTPRQLFSVPAR